MDEIFALLFFIAMIFDCFIKWKFKKKNNKIDFDGSFSKTFIDISIKTDCDFLLTGMN